MLSMTSCRLKIQELTSDPGIVILYSDSDTVHTALGQAGSPVAQGATAGVSLTDFKEFVFNQILATPVAVADHCVVKTFLPIQHHHEVFHRLAEDKYRAVIELLMQAFVTSNTATARWSLAVSSGPHVPGALPLHGPLGQVLKVTGGVGLGQVVMEPAAMAVGIFRQ